MTEETTGQTKEAQTALKAAAQPREASIETKPRTRRRLVAVALLAVLTFAGAGFTVAHVVDVETAENVLTFGNVSMRVVQVDGEGNPVENNDSVRAESGVATRKVTFENVGSTPMYVRAKPVMTGLDADDRPVDTEMVADVTEFEMDNTGAWSQRNPDDGWYYYEGEVDPGESTSELMTGIEFGGDFSGLVGQYGRYDFTVEAQAVQSENQDEGTTALTAVGWPESESDAEGE